MEENKEQSIDAKKKTSRPLSEFLWKDKPRNFFGLALNFTRYAITTDKFITSKGFFSINEDEILLYRVVDKSLKLPLSQRIFGCGTITIHVRDSDTPEIILKSIKNPRGVLALLDQVIDNSKSKYAVHGKDMYGAMGGSSIHHDIDVDNNGIPDVLE